MLSDFELEQSEDGGAWTTVAAAVTEQWAHRPVQPGHAYRYRVTAVDNGSESLPATSPSYVTSRYSESNGQVEYSGTWSTRHSPVFWGGAAKRAVKEGSTAWITFTGRSVAWVARMGPNRGKAKVFVNGTKVATVDLYSSTFRDQRVVWVGNWSRAASRKVTIRVLGTAGRPRVDLDAFVPAR